MSRPFIKANGGSPGVKASVSAASSVTLTLDSLIGVVTVAWSVLTTDETTSADDYTLVVSGSRGQTCTFDAMTAGTAVIVKVTINGGLVRDRVDLLNTTNTIKIFVPTAEGFEVGCAGETFESDSTVGTTGILNQPIRQLNTFTTSLYENDYKRALASKDTNVALTGNPSPMDGQTIATGDFVLLVGQNAPAENGLWKVNTAGAWTRPDNFATQAAIEGCTIVVIRGNARAGYIYQNTNTGSIVVGTTALTFSRLPDKYDRVDLGNASSTPAGNIIAKFGASSQLLASFFSSSGSNPAQVGILRGLYNSVLVAARDALNSSDLQVLSMSGTDVVTLGSSLVEGIRASVKPSGLFEFLDNTIAFLTASKTSGFVFGRLATMSIAQTAAVGSGGSTAVVAAQDGDAGYAGGQLSLRAGEPGAGSESSGIELQCRAGATYSGALTVKGGAVGTLAAIQYVNANEETVLGMGPKHSRIETATDLTLDTENLALFDAGSFASGKQMIFIRNTTATPSGNPSGGGLLYVENGALTYRSPLGTTTTVGPL